MLTRQLGSFEGLAPVEAVRSVLCDAGCPAGESVHLLRTLVANLIGALLREVDAGPSHGTTDLAGIARCHAIRADSGLPAVAAAAPDLARFDAAAEYAFTVDFALDELIGRLDRR